MLPLVIIRAGGIPGQAVDHYNRGVDLQAEFKFSEAIEEYDKAIEIHPEFMEAYCNRAMCHGALGNLDQALADASSAVELAPSDPHPYYVRGLAYADKGVNDRAIADLQKALDLGLGGMEEALATSILEQLAS